MIDWIVGWMHLLYLDYILDVNFIMWIIFILTFSYINRPLEIWRIKRYRNKVKQNESSADKEWYLFLSLHIILGLIILHTFAITSLNKLNFYIQHNGEHSNLIYKCIEYANSDNDLNYCVYNTFSDIRDFKRNNQQKEYLNSYQSNKEKIIQELEKDRK